MRAAPQRHDLRHRGDWEPADALALVHHWEWARAVERLARLASRWVEVRVLSGDLFAPRLLTHGARHEVRVMHTNTDSPWIRDYGPVQVFERGEPRWLDFAYADERTRDDRIPSELADHFHVTLQAEHERLDGGAIASNGLGLCAITERSLDESGFTRDDPTLPAFAARLGCAVLAVLPALPGEPTGHVDVFAQFLGPHVVGVGAMDAKRDPAGAATLDRAAHTLARAAAALGQSLRVVRIPIVAEGAVVYSYLNGTPIGQAFIMPSYQAVDLATEDTAFAQLQSAMPQRTIIRLPADEMISYGGAIHCITTGLSLERSELPAPKAPATSTDFWSSVLLR